MSNPETSPLEMNQERRVQAILYNQFLPPGQELEVDLQDTPYYPSRVIEGVFGVPLPGVVGINAGGHEFVVLDDRTGDTSNADFLVVDKSFDPNARRGFVGIRNGKSVDFGRDFHWDRFDFEPTVSRRHFNLTLNMGRLIVRSYESLNPLSLTGKFVMDESLVDDDMGLNLVRDIFTTGLLEDMQERFDFGSEDTFAPYGYYKNHHIIGRRTNSVKDGVYFTTNPESEAVVVDDRSKILKESYSGLKLQLDKKYGQDPATVPIQPFLEDVMKYAQSVLRPDNKRVDALSEPYYKGNQLIGLSQYVKEGVGVCRHHCLLIAYYLENLIDENQLTGSVSVERNSNVGNGSHSWTIYKSPNQEFVVDAAQEFVGTKEQSRYSGGWNYYLHDD